ncbi:sodium:calcium antiporter, partial [Lutimaribacter sp. EGI FJ00014]|nr:sodium:calcium antiporter [Lutimaribacter sp. EGI FJ00014]
VLLAGVTSLPEIGVTATASVAGNAELAVNNLFGSIALQVTLLAIIDFVIGRKALTAVVPEATVILQGSLNVILISAAAAAMVVGDVNVFGVGLWGWGALFGYLACVRVLSRAEGRRPWLAAEGGRVVERLTDQKEKQSAAKMEDDHSLRSLLVKTAIVAAVILIAGYVVAKSGEAIAQKTGLGSSFVGFVLVAIAT